MKKSLTLLLLGGALLFAAPANAQKKSVRATLPERQMTREQAREAVAARKHYAATQKSDVPFYLKRDERTPMKPIVKHNFVEDLKANNSLPKMIAKAPRKATTETFYSPYEFKFTGDNNSFSLFTTIDGDGDGKTFQNLGTYAACAWSVSADATADDWLITPGLNLTAKKYYNIKVTAPVYSSGYPERFEVKWGTAPTAEGMTNEGIATVETTSTAASTYEFLIRPEETGVFYVGVHCTSVDAYYLLIHSIVLENGPATTTPAATTDLTVTPDAAGGNSATITCTAPTLNLEDNALSSITGVKVYRNSEELADITRGIAIGEPFTFLDEDVEGAPGNFNYAVVFYNEDGDGAAAQQEAYVGLDTPTAIINPVLKDNGTNLTLTWDEPKAAHGGTFFPKDLLYGINIPNYNEFYYYYYNILYWEPNLNDGLVGVVQGQNSWTANLNTNEGEQYDLSLAVYVQNEAGYGWDPYNCLSNTLLLGAPYTLPWNENFADGQFHGYWSTADSEINNNNAGLYVVDGADDDGICVGLVGHYDILAIKSGKISLAGAANPTLVYKTRNLDEEPFPGMLQVIAITPDGEESLIDNIDYTAAVDTEWGLRKIDLSSLKNEKYIQLLFQYTVIDDETEDYHEVDIDDVNVLDYFNKNVKVDVVADEEVARNAEAQIAVKITNTGAETVDSYRVKLTVGDDEVADYTTVESIEPFTTKTLNFTYTVSNIQQAASIVAKAEVTVEGDEDTSDNIATASISIAESEVNPVQNLAISGTDAARTLTWEAPEVPNAEPTEITATFEKGAEGFISIDADGDGYGWQVETPGEGYTGFTSYSYVNYVGAKTPNDWLISPLAVLDGTFKFKALNAGASYGPEYLEVLVTTGDREDLTSYEVVLPKFDPSGADLTEYTADLTSYAGAEGYIAIRHYDSSDAYFVYVDDITYTAAAAEAVPVAKYNVYRNGQNIAETTALTFTDTDELADGEYTYQVTAIYEDGTESAPVAVKKVIVTDGIATVISNGEAFDVYSINGMKVREGATTLSGLKKGVYVVNGKKITIK